MQKAIIKRSKWSRGKQAANALLVTEKTVKHAKKQLKKNPHSRVHEYPIPVVGTMCCLGFACLSVGATEKDIANESLPTSLTAVLLGLNDSDEACQFCRDAASINDDPDILDVEREEDLIRLARKNNWKFEFVP